MEFLGWNPNNGEPVVRESYTGEYKERVPEDLRERWESGAPE